VAEFVGVADALGLAVDVGVGETVGVGLAVAVGVAVGTERLPNNVPPPLSKVRLVEEKKCGLNVGCALDKGVP
jgi:hypothetical protein